MATSRRELRFTLDDQAEGRYQEVLFEVPSGTASLAARIEVSGGGVIDLGCRGSHAWRGWSGGARRDFVITETAATPGYLPGPLEPGAWAVVLGLHQLPDDGVTVAVEISLPADVPPAAEPRARIEPGAVRGSERGLPASEGLTWYAGDLHAHTLHSDGAEGIDQLAARAVRSGLDFCAVTDHNTVSHHRLLGSSGRRHDVVLVPGQEVTTHSGHANVFGDVGWIDFRRPADDWLAAAADRGGLFSINHPLSDDCAFYQALHRPTPALELWHISWYADLTHTGPWAYLRALARSRPDGGLPVLLGGSDFHNPADRWTLGTPTTWVAAAAPTPEAILDGVRAGRTALSIGVRPDAVPDPMRTPVLLRLGENLVAAAADGAFLVDADGRRQRVRGERCTLPARGSAPYHLEDGSRRVLAITA